MGCGGRNTIKYPGPIKGIRGFTPGCIPYTMRPKGVWKRPKGVTCSQSNLVLQPI